MENPQLRRAIENAQLGFVEQARFLLLQVIRQDQNSELAWLWLAQVLDDPKRQRDCLRRVLHINPNNIDAYRGLEALEAGRPIPEPGTAAEVTADNLAPESLPFTPGVADTVEPTRPVIPKAAPPVEESPSVEVSAPIFMPDDDEVGEPLAEVAPETRPESFLRRARRLRSQPASSIPVIVPSASMTEPAAMLEDAEGLASDRAMPDQTPRLEYAPPRSRRFRLLDRRVLFGILGFVDLPLLIVLLFLLLRGNGGALIAGLGIGTQDTRYAGLCRDLDLSEFTLADSLGGMLTVDTIYSGTSVLLTETIVVPDGLRLLVNPGATLVFTPGASIEVYGGLYACGNDALSPVVFTGDQAAPGGWEGIRFYNPATESVLSQVVIDYAGERALFLGDSPVALESVKIAHSARFPISLDGNRVPDLSRGIDLNDNPFQGVEIRPGTLTATSAEWTDYNIPYVITGLVRVDEAATLDVKPGVVVKFWREPQGQLSGIWVRGLLKAEGVHFTSIYDSREEVGGATYLEAIDPQPGDWGSITFFESSAKSYLRNVEVRYGGKSTSAVSMRSSSPELTNVTVTDSDTYPLSADVSSFPELHDITLTDNLAGDVLEIRGGKVTPERGEYVWHVLGGETPVVRVIRDVLVIGPEATLTIDPGVIVKFGEEGQLVVQGTLSAIGGAAAERIVFTSVRDDDYGGDTDGNASRRDRREWGGIVFDGADTTSVLFNVLVRYAPITMLSASPKLSNSEIADAPGAGLRLSPDSVPELTFNRFDENGLRGISVLTGTISSDVRWAQIGVGRDQVVRILEGEVIVGPRAGLQIDAGTIIKAGPAGKLTVLGDLRAVGSGTTSIIFTALSDDTLGGDTDNRLLEPDAGDWIGLELSSEANARLGNVAIFYAQVGLTLLGDEMPFVDGGYIHIANGVNALRCQARMEIPVEFLIENNEVDTARCPAP